MLESNSKVTASHLKREAYLYIRQSTMRQLIENTESTQRQYSLRQRALALGWTIEQVQVIDSDQGQSGASATDREGFQKLVAEVSLGRAGIVMGLEVSRLARNNADWHRLLEICALSNTLILDEDGLYNPNDFNDRLLLGLKGAMSEAELHLLRARLRGGMLNKARRGEYACPLPIGFVYDDQKQVQLDPDQQVRETITLLFATYRRTGSASATVKHFKKQRFPFPRRLHSGLQKGELAWGELTHSRTLELLHNPRYTGAYCFGRSQVIRNAGGGYSRSDRPRNQWHALIPDAHAGLYFLGGIRGQPAAASRICPGFWNEFPPEPAAGRAGATAGNGNLRNLRKKNECPLSSVPRPNLPRLFVRARLPRAWTTHLPAYSRCGDRQGYRGTATGNVQTDGAGSGAGGAVDTHIRVQT